MTGGFVRKTVYEFWIGTRNRSKYLLHRNNWFRNRWRYSVFEQIDSSESVICDTCWGRGRSLSRIKNENLTFSQIYRITIMPIWSSAPPLRYRDDFLHFYLFNLIILSAIHSGFNLLNLNNSQSRRMRKMQDARTTEACLNQRVLRNESWFL